MKAWRVLVAKNQSKPSGAGHRQEVAKEPAALKGISLHSTVPTNAATMQSHTECAFGSMRFGEQHGVVPMAQELQRALASYGVHLHIIDMQAGGNINKEVFSAIEASDTFIVFGSAKYGEDTGNQACTYYEYEHAFNRKKRIILIRMIPFDQDFDELQARVIFGANRLVLEWLVGQPMPGGLPDQIVRAIRDAKAPLPTSQQ
jgi:hypothetical protein